MAFYIDIIKDTENDSDVVYKYWSHTDGGVKEYWGYFSIKKSDLMNVTIIELALNDPNEKYFAKAWTKIHREFTRNHIFPDRTCYAA